MSRVRPVENVQDIVDILREVLDAVDGAPEDSFEDKYYILDVLDSIAEFFLVRTWRR